MSCFGIAYMQIPNQKSIFFYCTQASQVNIAAKLSAYFLCHYKVLDAIPEYVSCLWWKFKNQSDVNVIRKTILVWFINGMMLTIDSANAVHITVHEMALFLRGKRSELIHHPFFSQLWMAVTLCVHAGKYVNSWVPAQVSGSWQEVGWLLALALFQSQRTTLLPALPGLCFFFSYVWAELIKYSPKPEHTRNPVGHSLAGWSPGDALWGQEAAGGAVEEANQG